MINQIGMYVSHDPPSNLLWVVVYQDQKSALVEADFDRAGEEGGGEEEVRVEEADIEDIRVRIEEALTGIRDSEMISSISFLE